MSSHFLPTRIAMAHSESLRLCEPGFSICGLSGFRMRNRRKRINTRHSDRTILVCHPTSCLDHILLSWVTQCFLPSRLSANVEYYCYSKGSTDLLPTAKGHQQLSTQRFLSFSNESSPHTRPCQHRYTAHAAYWHLGHCSGYSRTSVRKTCQFLSRLDLPSLRVGTSERFVCGAGGVWDWLPCTILCLSMVIPRTCVRHIRSLWRNTRSSRIVLAHHLHRRRLAWMEAYTAYAEWPCDSGRDRVWRAAAKYLRVR